MSIRLRLALWYSTILGLAIVAFGATLYVLMAQHLDNEDKKNLKDRAEHVAAALKFESPSGGLPGLILPNLDVFEAPGIYVQVRDPDGTILGRSASLAGRDLPLDEPTLARARFEEPVLHNADLEGKHLRLYTKPVRVGNQFAGVVQVALSMAKQRETLDRLLMFLVAGGVGALALATAAGWALAKRALRPVADMAETARAIALSQGFSRRLDHPHRRDEVGLLAITFNEMLASLEAAYAAQRRFVADASHELRAPLTTIRGNLDLLAQAEKMPPEERARALADAREEAERLSRLIADLLSVARADAAQRFELRPVELDALLISIHKQVLPTAPHLRVSVKRLEPLVVSGDEDRLKQLILILVDNALRYTPAGGWVSLSLQQEESWAVLQVADSGIGIEPEDLPHIFDRFYRADKARARDPGGSGLGLSIAKWIVEEHGGEIGVESVVGKGTTFTVRLPAEN